MGGIETHVMEVSRRLVAMGHDVTVLTTDSSGSLQRSEVVDGIKVRRVPVVRGSGDALLAPRIYSAVSEIPCDVMHVQGFHTFVPPLAMAAAVRSDIPFVATFHSGGHSSPLRHAVRGLQRLALKPLLLRAAQLIGVSEFEARLFANGLGVPVPSVRVVPNGSQMAPPATVASPDPDRPLVVSMGRLEKYKGHHRAIDAFVAFRKLRPGATLRILGEGPYRQALEEKVRRLGLEGEITIGGIPPSERGAMADLLSRAALILFLSEYEAHPVAALEAIALGRPALATNATGFMEMVERGEVAGVAPEATPTEVARAMVETIEAPARGRPQISDWDTCARTLLDIYRTVASRRPAAGGAPGDASLAKDAA
nr:glycosyltransferase family 4 protein [uncultured Alsobacter sp.]